jgi:hypothetical protein
MRTLRTFVAVVTFLVIGAGAPGAASPQHGDASPRGDGIKVHGSWTIELTNPDGSVAGTHSFENALLNQGAEVLATLLGGATGRGTWAVQVGTPIGGQAPCRNGVCLFTEDRGEVTVELTSNGQAVKLSATTTATQDGDISLVTSNHTLGNRSFVFSQRTLATPIHVVAGQGIAVSVVFSFS